MENEQWKEDILEIAYRFAREGQELIDFANGLLVVVEEADRETCLALVAGFLERLIARRAGDA